MIYKSSKDVYIKLFVVTSILFGLNFCIIDSFSHGIAIGIRNGLFAGIAYGLFMSIFLGLAHQLSNKGLNTDYVESLFGVHQVNVVILNQPFEEAFDTCIKSLGSVKKCTIEHEDRENGVIRAKTGSNWKTFGEKILLTISADMQGRSSVSISSKPKISTTMVDYGKNVENVRAIICAMEKYTELIETQVEDKPEFLAQSDELGSKVKINETEKEEL